MLYKFFTLIFILLLSLTNFAKTGYYRLISKHDPAHSYTIAWIQLSGKNVILKYDTQENFKINGKLNKTSKKIKFIKYKGLLNAFCELNNLKENTKYVFQIIDSDSKSEIMWFKTLPQGSNARLSIIAGGDSRSRPEIRRMANKMVAKLQPDLVIFDGDFTYSSTKEQWLQWFDDWQLTIANSRLIPIIVVPGNHEKKQDVNKFFNLLEYPHGYYSFNISGKFIHFISLNTQYKIPGKQTNWLENDLKHNQDATWILIAYHKPISPHFSGKAEGTMQYSYWAPLFYKYRIPLVLEGDTHTHKITYPIKPNANGEQGFSIDPKNGTVYIGEGCWGAPLRLANDLKSWTLDAASIDQFKWLWIDSTQIQIRTVLYKSVDSTQTLDFDNRFTIPKGIKIRKINDNQTVFTITKNK